MINNLKHKNTEDCHTALSLYLASATRIRPLSSVDEESKKLIPGGRADRQAATVLCVGKVAVAATEVLSMVGIRRPSD